MEERITRQDLYSIATYQKVILLCILAYILAVVAQFVVPPALKLLPLLGGAAVSIVATVFVFMLAIKIYSTGVGIVLGLLTLLPIVGLIVLLIVNQKATGILQRNGVQVGLLGARMKDFK